MKWRSPRSQFWREVAEAFDTPAKQRTPRQRCIARSGLCWGICCAADITDPSAERDVSRAMRNLGDAMGIHTAWWWPIGRRRADKERATFAGFLAAMSQRDRDRLFSDL